MQEYIFTFCVIGPAVAVIAFIAVKFECEERRQHRHYMQERRQRRQRWRQQRQLDAMIDAMDEYSERAGQ